MALANAKAHVSLNGQNYVLIEESYEKRAQQPFSARFATGDPSTGDLSFWQFLTQKGWTGEGQEKFDVVTKYRQSAGWDMRDGRARLGIGTESVVLSNAMPSPLASSTFSLYDDFEDASAPTAAKWNTQVASLGGPDTVSVGGSYRFTIGAQQGYTSGADARVAGSIASLNKCVHEDAALAADGEWRCTFYTETSALDVIHGAFMFLANATGGYCLEVSGADMVTWKLIKFARSGTNWQGKDDDTTVATFVATAKSATATVCKITRDDGGNFEVFQDGVSLGTVTDTTYETPLYIGISTYAHYTGPGDQGRQSASFIDDVYLPGVIAQNNGIGGKFVPYENGLYTCSYTSGTAFAFTTLRESSLASNLPKIVHQNASDMVIWSRDQEPTTNKNIFLASVLNNTLRCYNSQTQVFTGALTLFATCVIPISSTVIVVMGTTAANNGVPGIEVITMNAGAWTVASQKVVTLDGATSGSVCNGAALDSNGSLYFATMDVTATDGAFPSRLFVISATDLVATRPTITAIYPVSDFTIRSLVSLAGSVYLCGARLRDGNSYASVLKFPSTVIWESTKAVPLDGASATYKFNHGVLSTWKKMDGFLFLGINDLDLWDPILTVDVDGNVLECASFASERFDLATPTAIPIAEWNGRFYLLNSEAGTIKRTTGVRGSLGADFSYAVLEMSKMGANTDLINKTLYSVTVDLSEAVPSGETLSVLVNDTVVGTMVNADGARKEIVLTSELTSAAFICKLRWPQASTWDGYIGSGPLLKYVPTQFKKRAWGFGIRATKRLKYGDGTHETRTPTTMFSDIEAAWASNIPVTFIDVDGTSYSVLVTDFKQKRPLLQMNRSSEQEAFYFVELLQV